MPAKLTTAEYVPATGGVNVATETPLPSVAETFDGVTCDPPGAVITKVKGDCEPTGFWGAS